MDPPPPPPPHGSNQSSGRSGGLPDGKYDIFVIPPHSSGSGFLYLPSLHTHRNSFLAGVACAAVGFLIWSVVIPVIRDWCFSIFAGGGSGIFVLIIGTGVACWAWGRTQGEGLHAGKPSGAGGASGSFGGSASSPGAGAGGASGSFGGSASGAGAGAGAGTGYTNGTAGGTGFKSSWHRPNAQTTGASGGAGAKTSWEKAREETRKKEEERRKTEEAKRKREEAEKERQRQREKEARERLERERKQKEERSADSPKKPPNPTARTENEDDAYSFRPYDRPKRPVHKANSAASVNSESSYAASQTTARTTPPPTRRAPYTTKDPDKIIIKGVYSFNNAFQRTPIAQLLSGKGNVTDGLILRITTEGLFIDDDVRGVPQREWDIKAWTMKLAEVWCPCFAASEVPNASSPGPPWTAFSPFKHRAAPHRSPQSPGTAEAFMRGLAKACCAHCCGSAGTDYYVKQTGEMVGLHVLRASIRDQDGKKYVFVLNQSEGWKVAIGLQRLRKGSQVRALGISGLPAPETKALIETLGWA